MPFIEINKLFININKSFININKSFININKCSFCPLWPSILVQGIFGHGLPYIVVHGVYTVEQAKFASAIISKGRRPLRWIN